MSNDVRDNTLQREGCQGGPSRSPAARCRHSTSRPWNARGRSRRAPWHVARAAHASRASCRRPRRV